MNEDPEMMTDADEDEELDLRFVSENQIACAGFDLCDMLNFDEGVDVSTYARLHLTPHKDEEEDFDIFVFDEIDDDKYYMITFPDGTDFTDFSMKDALEVEEISEKCFNDLALDDSEMACDGNCEDCPQECVGKLPVE